MFFDSLHDIAKSPIVDGQALQQTAGVGCGPQVGVVGSLAQMRSN